MLYIPDDWIINKEKSEHIHFLLRRLDKDILIKDDTTVDDVLEELRAMGEAFLVEKVEDGTIMFGA